MAFPLFAAGGLSPADTILDLLAAAILIRLLGWHWAFLPTLFAELIPGLDLFPMWTAAIFYVTRQHVHYSACPLCRAGDSASRSCSHPSAVNARSHGTCLRIGQMAAGSL
jgi:hypothetical protein